MGQLSNSQCPSADLQCYVQEKSFSLSGPVINGVSGGGDGQGTLS